MQDKRLHIKTTTIQQNHVTIKTTTIQQNHVTIKHEMNIFELYWNYTESQQQ